jgi:hypothetical protein
MRHTLRQNPASDRLMSTHRKQGAGEKRMTTLSIAASQNTHDVSLLATKASFVATLSIQHNTPTMNNKFWRCWAAPEKLKHSGEPIIALILHHKKLQLVVSWYNRETYTARIILPNPLMILSSNPVKDYHTSNQFL